MQYIYLGEARFCQERVNEFLMVSNNLEIKDLLTGTEMNQTNSNNESNDHVNNVSDEDDDGDPPQTFNEHPNFEQKVQTSTKPIIRNNTAIKKEGVRYFCNQCDYQAKQQGHLISHIQSKHEGVKYACPV